MFLVLQGLSGPTSQPSTIRRRDASAFLRSDADVALELKWKQETGASPYCSFGIRTGSYGCNRKHMRETAQNIFDMVAT